MSAATTTDNLHAAVATYLQACNTSQPAAVRRQLRDQLVQLAQTCDTTPRPGQPTVNGNTLAQVAAKYAAEIGHPAPDYTMRLILRDWMAELLDVETTTS